MVMAIRVFNAALLSSCRRKRGWSPDQLAKKIGLKNGKSIRDAESGLAVPRDETIRRLCEVFPECSPDDFWSDAPHPDFKSMEEASPPVLGAATPVVPSSETLKMLDQVLQRMASGNEAIKQLGQETIRQALDDARRRSDQETLLGILSGVGELLKVSPGLENEAKRILSESIRLLGDKK